MANSNTIGAGAGPLLFYTPDRICVIVPHDFRSDTESAGGEDRHAAARAGLNARLRDLQPGQLAFPNSLARHLGPTDEFWAYLDRYRDRDLLRRPDSERPWVELPPDAEGRAATLAFYDVGEERFTLGPDGTSPDPDRVREQADRLRELVNALNTAEGMEPGLVATPNWFFGAAPYFCPSPGAKPESVAAAGRGRWTFEFAFDNQALEERVRDGRELSASDVVVAILDTCPDPCEIRAAAASFGDNGLLQAVVNNPRITIDGDRMSLPQSYFARLKGYLPNWRQHLPGSPAGLLDDTYQMRDHGLFITGIVHDIAPHAEIHLIRVLGGYGVSTLEEVAGTLTRLPGAFLDGRPTRRLIVNLSLGGALPPGAHLLNVWFPPEDHAAFHEWVAPFLGRAPDFDSALNDPALEELRAYVAKLRASVERMLAWIAANDDVLVVAAAGNDSDFIPSGTTFTRPEPRWPARYDAVLGVAALNRKGGPAQYSNRGDVRQLGNGVAVWGGEANHGSGQELGRIDLSPGDPDQVDAIKGLYSAGDLTLGAAGSNATGWAYWAGTSFATPIIAGIAANLWAGNPGDSAAALITLITGRNGASGGLAEVPNPQTHPAPEQGLDCRVIHASQRFV